MTSAKCGNIAVDEDSVKGEVADVVEASSAAEGVNV
jgi:hypothetical protein